MNTIPSTPESLPDHPLTPVPAASQDSAESRDSVMELDHLPLAARLFIDEDAPAEIVGEIARRLLPEERIFVLLQLNAAHTFAGVDEAPDPSAKVPLWIVITGSRLLLLAVSSQGQTYCESFDRKTVVEYQNGLARDEIRIADTVITTGVWEGKRKLFKDALALFPLPEYEKYLYLAGIYSKNDQYTDALPFLQASLASEPTITAYLLQAHTYSRTGTPDKAIDVLQQACRFADPAAIIAEIQAIFADNLVMFLYLAVVCEKNQWWDAGLSIYQYLLRKTPDFDLYSLKIAELYNWKHAYAQAVTYYQTFIRQRTAVLPIDAGDFIHWDLSDSQCFGADPDLMKAYCDLAGIYAHELRDPQQALGCYLELIRHAPFGIEAYQHFWQVYRQALFTETAPPSLPTFNLAMFLQVYQLLHPHSYAQTVASEDLARLSEICALPPALNSSQPPTYRPLRDSEHTLLTHPGELEYWRKIRSWITNLVVSDTEEQGIEQYCEQVSQSNYPHLMRIIEQVARFMGITPPRGFISRGKIGISVKNKEHPFIFIGSEHLQAEHDRFFSDRELLFIIAVQAEHIKSGHILITDTELWKSLGTASFDGFLTALQLLPAGSFIGRLTHHFATEGLKRVYKMTKYSTIQKVLKFVERHVAERPLDNDTDAGEAGADARSDRLQAARPDESEALLREQLVDFARHAVYTADRVGVLACHDVQAACSAVFKLVSDTSYDELKTFEHDGLLALMNKHDKREKYVYFEYAKRLSELIRFVLSETYENLYRSLQVDPRASQAVRPSQSEYASIVKKLTLLEQSRQNELLTQDELFSKQQQVFALIEWLSDNDLTLLRKYQQACQDGVLTTQELHAKIVQHLQQGATV